MRVMGRISIGWATALWMYAAVGAVRPLDAAAQGETTTAVMAADADPDWEVATVRPSDPNEKEQSFMVRGRHIIVKNQTVEKMLMVGYGLQKDQIAGAPEWVKTENFDVDGVADVEGQPQVKQFQTMVRKLLLERFGLKTHKEQREMPVYALTVVKDGPKLTPSKSGPNTLPREEVRGDAAGVRTLEFVNISMQDFVVMMLYYVDKPVVDHTNLKGTYDFTLKYTYDDERAPTDGTAPAGLFTAIQEQDGLKLEPMRAAADVVVVDQIQRPSAN